MEKAKEFLNIYDNSSDYRDRFFSLYNALFILMKDDLWEKVESVGIKKERMEDALLYLREDEEKGGKTVLEEDELSLLHSLVLSMIKG
ncbi:MAG: hypothetical protein ACI4NB_01875 [Candidatus Ornithospirochaeta sp.]|nr:hypothetical protein [Spirochaetales bacterium]